ncbi:hypothetical protein [Terracidiphilus gabretensis]|uniref:hypothetical protein n=1 Tax=Terracidiphilus gabretensis TaxID=1577687 RepID=UPI00071B80E8|nr:hypothetical protein [Terracidiphilus gabretensis]
MSATFDPIQSLPRGVATAPSAARWESAGQDALSRIFGDEVPGDQHSTVADYIEAAAAPYVSPDLISRDSLAEIGHVANLLPGAVTDFFGFECPLGVLAPTADFLVCSRASQGGREVLTDRSPGRSLPANFNQHPVWQQVFAFSRAWDDPTSPLFEAVHNIWMEFDMDGKPASIPVPSLFLGSNLLARREPARRLKRMPEHCAWLTDQALPLLLGRPLDRSICRQVACCVNLLPAGARIFQVGLMLSRATAVTRLCVRGLASVQIPEYLEAIGWEGARGEVEATVDKLAPLVERIDLDIDVGDSVMPKIGLECYPAQDLTKLRAFMNYLMSCGLCVEPKADGLVRWAGLAHERVTPQMWPRELLALSSFLGGRVESAFFRWLHHVKVVHVPDHPPAAKAYLAVHHQWIAPGDLKQMLSRATSEPRDHGRTH